MAFSGDDPPTMMNVDRLVHEPARFMILSYLCVVERADFLFLMKQIGLTRGNLSSHMTKLEEAGYIKVKKTFKKKKPNTMLSITMKGRKAYDRYTKQMKWVFIGL